MALSSMEPACDNGPWLTFLLCVLGQMTPSCPQCLLCKLGVLFLFVFWLLPAFHFWSYTSKEGLVPSLKCSRPRKSTTPGPTTARQSSLNSTDAICPLCPSDVQQWPSFLCLRCLISPSSPNRASYTETGHFSYLYTWFAFFSFCILSLLLYPVFGMLSVTFCESYNLHYSKSISLKIVFSDSSFAWIAGSVFYGFSVSPWLRTNIFTPFTTKSELWVCCLVYASLSYLQCRKGFHVNVERISCDK
jgi:hypothetical protein